MRSPADARPDRTQPDATAADTIALTNDQRLTHGCGHVDRERPIGHAGRLAVGQSIGFAVRVASSQRVGGCLADRSSQS